MLFQSPTSRVSRPLDTQGRSAWIKERFRLWWIGRDQPQYACCVASWGLTSYYKKFERNYGSITRPLVQLLKKGGFEWNEEAKEAFKELKAVVVSTLVLALPNFDEEFTIETDASGGRIV